jgi:hypothetical protein
MAGLLLHGGAAPHHPAVLVALFLLGAAILATAVLVSHVQQ